MKKVLFVVYSYHHFLVAVAKTCQSNYKSDIVFSNLAFKSGFEEFASKVENLNLFNNVIFYNELEHIITSKKNIFKYYYYELFGQKKYFEEATKINLKSYDDIFVFSDVFTIGAVLSHQKIKYHLLEDTVNTFTNIDWSHSFVHKGKNTAVGRLFWIFNLGHMLYGNDDACKEIEVNSISNKTVPLPMSKVKIVDRNELIYSIPQDIKNSILKLFDVDLSDIEQNSALLLTEPLYVDGRVSSEDEQLKVYNKLITKYLNSYKVVIKPHPRDNIDYVQTNAKVIRGKFPSEILGFSEIKKFTYAITINSSSIYGLTFIDDKKLLGLDVIKQLLGD